MTRARSVLAVVVAAVGLGIGTYRLVHALGGKTVSVGTVENKIESDLDLRLIAGADGRLGATQSLASAAASAPSATVSCPHNARLTSGSVFYCDAAITTTSGDQAAPGQSVEPTRHRRVKVTFSSGGAFSWEILG